MSKYKFSRPQEHEFQEDFYQRNQKAQQTGLVILFLAAALFGLNQGGYTPSEHDMLIKVHYLFYMPVLTVLIGAWFFSGSGALSQAILACGVILTGGTYIAMERIAPTSAQSEASQTTVVLIVIVMAGSVLLRMRFAYAAFCTWALCAAYAFFGLCVYHLANGGWNIGAMAMGCVVSTLNAWIADRNARDIFLLDRKHELPH